MTTSSVPASAAGATTRRPAAVAGALLIAAVVAAAALLWAKWLPYAAKVSAVSGTHSWGGSDILSVGGVRPGDAPTWHAATSFFTTYVDAIWRALLAALLIGAAVQSLVPSGWAARLLNRRQRWHSAAAGGLAGTPSMMCTCCTAPVVATLRREGVGVAGAVAYWLANPLLNPAVLVFLAFVTPWQWTFTRIAVGLVVVVLGSALVARVTPDRVADAVTPPQPEPLDAAWLARAPLRFGRALLRLVLVLLPEYLVVVLLLGAFRGWLFPLGSSGLAHTGVLVVVLAAVLGTLIVLPTAGEIPIVAGLAAAGFAPGVLGALLLTLPAVSLPGAAMLAKPLGARSLAVTAGVVVVGGLLAGALLTVLA